MATPRMVIVAGPSGGGKTSIFPIFQMQIDAFSTDLRAATLLGEAKGANGPVFQPAPAEVALYMQFRKQAGEEMERFILEHIDQRRSSPSKPPSGKSPSTKPAAPIRKGSASK